MYLDGDPFKKTYKKQKTKKNYWFKKNNHLALMHKRRQVKLQFFINALLYVSKQPSIEFP